MAAKAETMLSRAVRRTFLIYLVYKLGGFGAAVTSYKFSNGKQTTDKTDRGFKNVSYENRTTTERQPPTQSRNENVIEI